MCHWCLYKGFSTSGYSSSDNKLSRSGRVWPLRKARNLKKWCVDLCILRWVESQQEGPQEGESLSWTLHDSSESSGKPIPPNLVGGFNPPEKYFSQLGWWFPIYGKIKLMFQTTNPPKPINSPACSRASWHQSVHSRTHPPSEVVEHLPSFENKRDSLGLQKMMAFYRKTVRYSCYFKVWIRKTNLCI